MQSRALHNLYLAHKQRTSESAGKVRRGRGRAMGGAASGEVVSGGGGEGANGGEIWG